VSWGAFCGGREEQAHHQRLPTAAHAGKMDVGERSMGWWGPVLESV
jgi:hypothetical protein